MIIQGGWVLVMNEVPLYLRGLVPAAPSARDADAEAGLFLLSVLLSLPWGLCLVYGV